MRVSEFFTIRVKGIVWHTYKCTHFKHEYDLGGVTFEPRLKLKLVDGRQIFIPRIATKRWEIGADYEAFTRHVAQLKAEAEKIKLALAEEVPPDGLQANG